MPQRGYIMYTLVLALEYLQVDYKKKFLGHEGEISKCSFNPQGTKIITAGSDKTARIWSAETCEMLQVLEGHTDEIFSCSFNYEGDTIITGTFLINIYKVLKIIAVKFGGII